jgi:hypothetical protein
MRATHSEKHPQPAFGASRFRPVAGRFKLAAVDPESPATRRSIYRHDLPPTAIISCETHDENDSTVPGFGIALYVPVAGLPPARIGSGTITASTSRGQRSRSYDGASRGDAGASRDRTG